MKKVLLDSSCWIEILTSGSRAKSCEKELRAATEIIVPTLVIYEVYRKISASTSEDQALSVVAALSQHRLVDLTRDIALTAADLSLSRKIPMADSFVLAHSQQEDALLITLDNDFNGIPGVKVLR